MTTYLVIVQIAHYRFFRDGFWKTYPNYPDRSFFGKLIQANYQFGYSKNDCVCKKRPKIEISKKWVCFPGEKTRKNLNLKNGCVLKDGPIRVNTKESGQR